MKRWMTLGLAALTMVGIAAGPAAACGGLVNPNGTVSLVRTTTLAGYKDGVEHYVTSFEFAGGGAEFGSIVPLPGIPSRIRRAGDWTLQRLVEEIQPEPEFRFLSSAGAASTDSAKAVVIEEVTINALDITVLKGGGDAVGLWAEENGFELTPDAPEILDFYARRSPIFMAARFDPQAAQAAGQSIGDGTPIHLSIPTPNPWVPLRILTLGLPEGARVEADVFLLTEEAPDLLPAPAEAGSSGGMILERSGPASNELIADLRSDVGMGWLPAPTASDDGITHGAGMWFSYLRIDEKAGALAHDLAVDAAGTGAPSPVAAGLEFPGPLTVPERTLPAMALVAALVLLWGAVAFRNRPVSAA